MPKAFILAAGLGTRLKPYTDTLPKALVPLEGRPLIAHVLRRLKIFGYRDILVNLHHHADKLQHYLLKQFAQDFNFEFSDESAQLLDTGGAIKKASPFLKNEIFLVHNCDVISAIPLEAMMDFHLQNKSLATLAVSARKTSRPLAFDQNKLLKGRWSADTGGQFRALAFSGVYILSPDIFSFMPSGEVFSIIDVLIAASGQDKVQAFEHPPEIWEDAGTMTNFEIASALLKKINATP
jgi:NDP-sugar pyrophosphorylase family protein